MFSSFFKLAAVSPGRQLAFRKLVAAHILILAGAILGLRLVGRAPAPVVLGNLLLCCGIVEGALLVGWRLTQLPKSQALEFVLASPLRPPWVLIAEALVGLSRLALATLAGLPLLLLLVLEGVIVPADLAPLLLMPLTWGAVTGLGLTAWAFEPTGVRRWGERLALVFVLLYLLIGILAGEQLRRWLTWLPDDVGRSFMTAYTWFHTYNPFAVMKYAMEQRPEFAWPRVCAMEMTGLALGGMLLARAAARLYGHFHDRHYAPALLAHQSDRGAIGNQPLSWWAVRRVREYSGRINLWLAGGFGLAYAVYTVAGPLWPDWLGRSVFQMFDSLGGVAVLATALVLLAAVPAAFQYGLWDSNAQDRCRRLELLLLTRLDAGDYWSAAAAAAWRRGRGYFAVAVLLWFAAWAAGQATWAQVATALAAAVILWGLYFALGFRGFSRGLQANGVGLLLTIGFPLLAYLLHQAGYPMLTALLPPGSVYQPQSGGSLLSCLPGPALGAVAALGMARSGLSRCDGELRIWYGRHHGKKMAE